MVASVDVYHGNVPFSGHLIQNFSLSYVCTTFQNFGGGGGGGVGGREGGRGGGERGGEGGERFAQSRQGRSLNKAVIKDFGLV